MSDPTDDDTPATPRRGRPRGRTAQGRRTRDQLYEAAVELIAEHGYDATTMRQIATAAGVSTGLLYRYFPSKAAVVLALYEALSEEYADGATELFGGARHPADGAWHHRFIHALRLSLEVLEPHRDTLVALVPVLVGSPDEGLFASATAGSRARVLAAFVAAVRGASDAPPDPVGHALGRLLYLAHLAVILWWLLDRSPGQRATAGLVAMLERLLPMAAMTLRLPLTHDALLRADALVRDALFDDG